MFNSNAPSVADIAAVTDGNGRNGYGFGEGWWAIIILMALFGWGRGGFGSYGSGSECGCCPPATCSDLQAGFNNQAIINKLNGLENGLCSLGYDQLAQMNNLGAQIQQGIFGLQQAINNASVASMQDTNSISRQLADCCCENREAIMNLRFQNAQDTCAITTAIQNQTQQIMQNDNANYRALHDELVAYQMQKKDETIQDLRTQVQAFNLAVSQRNQNDYLINQLRPCPSPAYVVPNPFCCNNGSNYNNGCGCGNGCC